MCVCVQSTNMFSASSRRSNQSSPRNPSNSRPQERLLPAGAAVSQQRLLREAGSSCPRAWPLPLPAWLPRPGHGFGTDVPEHIPGTGQHRRLKGFSLLLPLPLLSCCPGPPHTRPFFPPFLLQNQTKTRHSGAQELQPKGRSWRGRGWDTGLPRPEPARV